MNKPKRILIVDDVEHNPELLDLFFESFAEVLAIQEKYRMDTQFRTDLDQEEWR